MADSTLVTRAAFEIPYRALIIGLADDYAVLMPGIRRSTDPHAPALEPAPVSTLRDSIEDSLQLRTGSRVPAKDLYVLTGPYSDPLLGVPVLTAVSAYYEGDRPTALIAMVVPVDQFFTVTMHSPYDGTLILTGSRSASKACREWAARSPCRFRSNRSRGVRRPVRRRAAATARQRARDVPGSGLCEGA